MKLILAVLTMFLSAISAEAQSTMLYQEETEAVNREIVQRPRFIDNWSLSLGGGIFHPMCFKPKYFVDCSSYTGAIELRKQLTPIIGLGIEANGYLSVSTSGLLIGSNFLDNLRKERRDPRSVIGPVAHINLMNLFAGYRGRPRLFEMEASLMPAWGHLYRGSQYDIIPDEDYFATKYSLDFGFNLGRTGAWTFKLSPAATLDVTSKAPKKGVITNPYKGYDTDHLDLQILVGFTYRFRNHDGQRNFHFAASAADRDELNRLNEIVNYLRQDVEARDRRINELKEENENLKNEIEQQKEVIE